MSKRQLLASSHDGKYTYHLDSDRYVYQRDESTAEWCGWLCHLSAWDATFSRSTWMTLLPTLAEVA